MGGNQMKEVQRYHLTDGIVGYVTSLRYRINGLRVLLCKLMRSETTDEVYSRYMSEYKDLATEYEIAFSEIVRKVVISAMFGDMYKIESTTGDLIVYRRDH